MKSRIPLLLAGALVALAGCTTDTLPLAYASTAAPLTAVPASSIASVATNDLRHEDDPGWYGAVRGGFGNPLKKLRTPGPLADTISQAFTAALVQRGLPPTADAPDALQVTIVKFQSDQMVNRESDITLHLALHRRRDSVILYEDDALIEQQENSNFVDVGIFGSVEKLQALNGRALSLVIDQLLSKPGFLAALRGGSSPSA